MPSQISGQAPKPSKNVARRAKKPKAVRAAEAAANAAKNAANAAIDKLNPFD